MDLAENEVLCSSKKIEYSNILYWIDFDTGMLSPAAFAKKDDFLFFAKSGDGQTKKACYFLADFLFSRYSVMSSSRILFTRMFCFAASAFN